LFALFFLSGASGLMFEIVWIRALGVRFGTTAPAIATVLAAFMAGLALGNLLVGRVADRSTRPLHLYRLIELGIGLTGLGVSALLLHGDPVLAAASRGLAATGPLMAPLRFLLFFSLLLLPATLMGATLPVISRALVRSGTSGRVVGVLYALNTTGAVVGVLLPDLWIVPALGLTATAAVACLGNLCVAVTVGRLQVDVTPVNPDEARARAPFPVAPAVLYGVSGLCAMGIEVIWSRVIQFWTHGLITSFSILLAVFLACLSIGSYAAAPLADRVRRPLAWAAGSLALMGPAVLLPIAGAPWAQPWIRAVVPHGEPGWRGEPIYDHLLALANAVYLEAFACLLMGAALPFLAAAAVKQGSTGRSTGWLYATNTLAGVVGSVATGFFLLPALGAQAALGLLATLATVVGVGAVVRFAPQLPVRLGAAVVGVSLVVVVVRLPDDHLRLACFEVEPDRILDLREGATTTAAVVDHPRFGEFSWLELATPGVSMSSTGFGAQRYMGLMSLVPLLHSHEATDALLICYGVGNSARTLLAHEGLQQLDVVDISPEVVELSEHFAVVHGYDPLHDPRTVVHVDDGRQFLVTTDRRYDVITAEPPPPNDAGVVNLYSREYYALARAKLKPGGVLAQWFPVFQMSPAEVLSAVASMTAEFPHTAVYCGYQYQWFVLGSQRPLEIDAATWSERVETPSMKAELARLGVYGVADLIATWMQHDAALRAAVADVPPITDDHPTLQYPREALRGWVRYPEVMIGDPVLLYDQVRAGEMALRNEGLLDEVRAAVLRASAARQAVPLLVLGDGEARELAVGNLLRPSLAERPHDEHLLALLELDGTWTEPAEKHVAGGGADAQAYWVLARRAFYRDHWTEVLSLLDRVDPAAPGPAHHALLRGGALRSLGYTDAAAASFSEAAAATASPPFQMRATWLAEHAADPWSPEAGPLAVDEAALVASP